MTLSAGETLLLYTDGLIERRGMAALRGGGALVDAVSAAPDEPELMCRAITSRLTEGTEIADDIAVLAVQTVGLHDQLEVEMPAEAEQLATIRHLIRRWVAANDGSDDDCAAFAIAVSEACANAIEHAYGPGDAKIEIRAALVDGEATVTIRDRGAWREPRGENRGRGIPIMREFMDDVSIETGGSRERRWSFSAPESRGVMSTARQAVVREPGRCRAGEGRGRGRRLERRGPEPAAARAVSNKARALVLDLSETSYIDSSGISLIFDAAARLRNRRQELRLVVPPRSFVGEVLAAVSMERSVPIDARV